MKTTAFVAALLASAASATTQEVYFSAKGAAISGVAEIETAAQYYSYSAGVHYKNAMGVTLKFLNSDTLNGVPNRKLQGVICLSDAYCYFTELTGDASRDGGNGATITSNIYYN